MKLSLEKFGSRKIKFPGISPKSPLKEANMKQVKFKVPQYIKVILGHSGIN